MTSILIIEEDLADCLRFQSFLSRKEYRVGFVHTALKALLKLKEQQINIVICNSKILDAYGNCLYKEIERRFPHVAVLLIEERLDKINDSTNNNEAHRSITKPYIAEFILKLISSAKLSKAGVTQQKAPIPNDDNIYTTECKKVQSFFVGQHPAALNMYKQIELVAPTNYSVILQGETGTGKEIIAKAIHKLSKRSDKPFVALDCGTLSDELSGSELFGHTKGSFTGAHSDKIGHFELANGGTLFLDEIENLSLTVQASLLRVMQERVIKKIGSVKEIPLDLRVIVASHEDLQTSYKSGKFREDLYHRFNEFSIMLPNLRDRVSDIPIFAELFLKQSCKELNKSVLGFDNGVMELLQSYSWPGNIRELRNVVRRAGLVTQSPKIHLESLPKEIVNAIVNNLKTEKDNTQIFNDVKRIQQPHVIENIINLKTSASRAEFDTIMEVLKKVKFNKSKAARLLQIDRKTLYNKIKNH